MVYQRQSYRNATRPVRRGDRYPQFRFNPHHPRLARGWGSYAHGSRQYVPSTRPDPGQFVEIGNNRAREMRRRFGHYTGADMIIYMTRPRPRSPERTTSLRGRLNLAAGGGTYNHLPVNASHPNPYLAHLPSQNSRYGIQRDRYGTLINLGGSGRHYHDPIDLSRDEF